MQQKLTLRMEDNIIKKAKSFAHSRQVSLSKIVADYFKFLVVAEEQQPLLKKTPVLRELTGILKTNGNSNDLINKYKTHLTDKYL